MRKKVWVRLFSAYMDSLAALPLEARSQVAEFVNKYLNNPEFPGICYEKLEAGVDSKICSVRIDDTHSGIVVRQKEAGVYLLLWVGRNEEAYEWARGKRCEVNPQSGTLQIYDVPEILEAVPVNPDAALFAAASDGELLSLGLPEAQLRLIRTIQDEETFYSYRDSIPADAFEKLSWLVSGLTVEEVRGMLAPDEEKKVPPGDLAAALERPESMTSFVVVEGEEELRRIMAEPLAKWRVFLHPTQRRIVEKHYSGAARVLGGAGTGKTVVAMHRAKHLAARCTDQEKVLFTTFTANLAGDIRENLRKICTPQEMKKIEVIHLDAWVASFLREQGYSMELIYDDGAARLWEEAILSTGDESGLPASFYADEWNRVIAAQEAFTLPLYAKAARTGRGTRLSRGKRMQVWQVVERYRQLMKERRVRDVQTAMYECRLLASKAASKPLYKHVIVDEGQDLGSSAFRLLRTLAGEEHADDMFIVGDAHQRIYKNRASLSQCGIHIRGRSAVLRINYRTTEETRRSAFTILKGLAFDGMDDDADPGDRCQSLTHGQPPQIKVFRDAASELDYILSEVRMLAASGVSLGDICVIARTHRLLEDYISHFTRNGIHSYEIRRNRLDDQGMEGLRVATMHRVKGLEFKYVFLAAVNDRIVPLASAIDHFDKITQQETTTAEKCLLYVAMTRAQNAVIITSYGRKSTLLP